MIKLAYVEPSKMFEELAKEYGRMSIPTLILFDEGKEIKRTIGFIDKEKAKRNKYRIREKTLVLLSFLFGSCGGLIGMYLIRHKNRHIKFIITNWLFLIIHIVLGYFILTYAI